GRHQSRQLKAAAKVTVPGLFPQRLECSRQRFFVCREIRPLFYVIGYDSHPVFGTELTNQNFGRIDTLIQVAAEAAAVINDQHDRAWHSQIAPQRKVSNRLSLALVGYNEVVPGQTRDDTTL